MLVRVLAVLLLLELPLFGVALVGLPLSRFLEFPPITQPTVYSDFSWVVFFIITSLVVSGVSPFVWKLIKAHPFRLKKFSPLYSFPWWGKVSILWTIAFWWFAWNPEPAFLEVRRVSFTPLWLGYIATVNAMTWRRTGFSLVTHHPKALAWLFLISSAFWWFFEYLNRFVQNWYYQGIEAYTPFEYFITESLQFSTVLPAVLSTSLLLKSYPSFWWGLHSTRPVCPTQPRLLGVLTLTVGIFGLLGLGVFPKMLYPLVWIAPLILITSLQTIVRQRHVLSSVAQGDWCPIWLSALGGIICGFFWEMWNWHSGYPHWVYSVPWVQRFHLFEMPLLGYAGYLPFGIECLAIVQWLGFYEQVRLDQSTQDMAE
ncbi:conserved membrane hypothetical protein [Gammaproteobacteria bacterium]